MTAWTTFPLAPAFGVEIHGVQLADLAQGDGFIALRAAFEADSALLRRG